MAETDPARKSITFKSIKSTISNVLRHDYVVASIFVIGYVWLRHDWKHFSPGFEWWKVIDIGFYFLISLFIVYVLKKISTSQELRMDSDLRGDINEIITEARSTIFLVSPYLHLGNDLVEKLYRVRQNGVEITIIHNTRQFANKKTSHELKRLLESGCVIYNHPHLHAKIYANDKNLLVTSVNLVASSFENSLEVGISSDYSDWRKEIRDYIRDIINSDLTSLTTIDDLEQPPGYCIRCSKPILINPAHPYCIDCYKIMRESSRAHVSEKYCHICGKEEASSLKKPACYTCYTNNKDHMEFPLLAS